MERWTEATRRTRGSQMPWICSRRQMKNDSDAPGSPGSLKRDRRQWECLGWVEPVLMEQECP